MAITDHFVTDMQNFIIDLDLGVIENPVEFGARTRSCSGRSGAWTV